MQCLSFQNGSVGQENTVPVFLLHGITEKIQKPVNILTLPLILRKPLIVKGNVCDRPVGITVIPVMSASPLVLVRNMQNLTEHRISLF